MQKDSKLVIQLLIDDNKRAILDPGTKNFLISNPNYLEKKKVELENEIERKLRILEEYLEELVPYIKVIKKRILIITEETHMCAVYLLMTRVWQDWQSLITLAKKSDIGGWSFIRLIKESLGLVDLFVIESSKGEDKYKNKWFKGDIIGHAACRSALDDLFKQGGDEEAEMKNMLTHLYQMESLVIHCSYSTMLEGVSPYTRDFDFDGYTQRFRVSKSLDYAIGSMNTTNITLKFIYKFLLKDEVGLSELDEILKRFSP